MYYTDSLVVANAAVVGLAYKVTGSIFIQEVETSSKIDACGQCYDFGRSFLCSNMNVHGCNMSQYRHSFLQFFRRKLFKKMTPGTNVLIKIKYRQKLAFHIKYVLIVKAEKTVVTLVFKKNANFSR
jgi:hypothetical protein